MLIGHVVSGQKRLEMLGKAAKKCGVQTLENFETKYKGETRLLSEPAIDWLTFGGVHTR